ncbi:NAD-dependent epimerase/dehydratase family protein [Amycolatopsis panacis]|uniref:NAD-dependent epimerase/dehydratase family protein n=1 Tax=Amycolatopsis panacis TaxID=2340917 RepID=A0A419HJH5_9PSEU|nr:NAD-dependent epimerase/dehydratase family protein [Amycolatopsis panacis]RJQ75891.1 NAD-dependent epimerase/dehydratase family protein [Amycolatopsis panacis]
MTAGTRPLRLGIVGCGAVTERCHLPALVSGEPFRLTVLADSAGEHAARAGERYQQLREAKGFDPGPPPLCTQDISAALDEIDAAIVATGPASHASITAMLARAGKHVLLEKPVVRTVEECAEVRAAALAGGVMVVPAHVRRFFPAAYWIKQKLESGWFGTVRRVRWREGAEYGWPVLSPFTFDAKAGGGVLTDLSPHVADLLTHWFGTRIELVRCTDNRAGGVDTEVRLELRAGGVDIDIELSWLRRMENQITIEGSAASVSVGTVRTADYVARDADGAIIDEDAVPALGPSQLTRDGLFHRQLVEFDRALRGEDTAVATLTEAEMGVELSHRCQAERVSSLPRPWQTSRRIASRGSRRVAVTGATGFIGAQVVDLLLRDEKTTVVALGRSLPKWARLAHWDSERVEFLRPDILEATELADAVQGCDIVVHTVYGSDSDRARRWAVSVDGTKAVVAAARKAGVRRLVHVSSMSVYDPAAGPVLTEDSALVAAEPDDLSYAHQKLAAEQAVLQAAGDPMEVVCVQPTVVYGPGGPLWTVRPLRKLPEDNSCLPSEAGGVCNAVHVHDVAEAVVFLAEADGVNGRRLLLSGPESVAWGTFYDYYRDMLRLPRHHLPDNAAWSEADRKFYAGVTTVDTSRLATLGFRPRLGLAEGMAQVAEWASWSGLA